MPKFLSLSWTALGISILIFVSGCASSAVKDVGPIPPIVREHKHVLVHGRFPGMVPTSILLREGDFFSVLAKGSIDMCMYGGCTARSVGPELALMGRIGENRYFLPVETYVSPVKRAGYSGELYLGVRDGPVDEQGNPLRLDRYQNNLGAFNVDIIVWREKDWAQIENFFKAMNERNPSDPTVQYALNGVNSQRSFELARSAILHQVSQTDKELQELKEAAKRAEDRPPSKVASIGKEPFPPVPAASDVPNIPSKEATGEALEGKGLPSPSGEV